MADRDVDVVVFGATSVTGRRVAAYLATRAPAVGMTWAAAGRDANRVREVLADEGVTAPETIVADVADAESLNRMAARAKVVLNLVGPYTRHGRPVIAACVANGADYVDLTGEIPFVRRMVAEFDAPAREAGVKVVQVCGFESLPPDLGILLAAETAREQWDEELADVDATVTPTRLPPGVPRPSDFVSGGTSQSLAEAVGDDDASCLADPACLIPDGDRADEVRLRSPIEVRPRRNNEGAVVAPMAPAAFINPAVIHRSGALADPPAPPLRYREGLAIAGGPASMPVRFAAAAVLSGAQAGAGAIARASTATRRRASKFLRRALPDSGYGPRSDRIEAWRWRLDVRATTEGDHTLTVSVEGDGHPGYWTTARLLGEAGLLLATPRATPDRAGHLTPALAIGTAEIERFDHAGLRFSVAP